MLKHTQAIRRPKLTNRLSVSDHFWEVGILYDQITLVMKIVIHLGSSFCTKLDHFAYSQPAITCSKLTVEALEQGV